MLSLPEPLQETAFMLIQYAYAVLTMLPCPIWFYSRWASAGFLMVVFAWSVYNGATYYIDVFGKRFQKEHEGMKAEVAKWQQDMSVTSPIMTPNPGGPPAGDLGTDNAANLSLSASVIADPDVGGASTPRADTETPGNDDGIEEISLLCAKESVRATSRSVPSQSSVNELARERKTQVGVP